LSSSIFATVPLSGRVIGLDLGARRIGVAISDARQRVATGLTVVVRSGDVGADHQALAALAAEEEAVAVVVGLPTSLDGSVGPAAQGVRGEVEALRTVVGVPVEFIDERFTTVAASRTLQATGRRTRRTRQVVDQVAAAVILQSWLDRRQGSS
jgi:putative holliday junction resolvase